MTKVYRHQGNETASTSGELDDHFSKIGRVFREEQYDDSDNLYKLTVNKWTNVNRDGTAEFVSLATTTSLLYDGDGDHKDTAESYAYSTTTGDLLERIEWGEVTGSVDGSFTDTGSDKRTTAISYAASSTGYLILPSQETVTDQGASKIRETKNYYDTLSLGSVGAGNLTKQELWKSGSSYIDIEKTYNQYGLVTQEKDPRDKVTVYDYDAFNVYPATTTNPLSHVVARLYDYSSGKVKELTDANGRIFQTMYDALDRVLEEKQPDLSTPSTLVTKAVYEYTDTGMPRRVKRTSYLNASSTVDTYTYLDGLGRTVEERTEAEDSNYAVKDYFYNERGLLESESLPFFDTGTSYTGTSSPPASTLLTRYTYDPLGRTTAMANNVGTTTHVYDQWTITTTDAIGSVKDATNDAYGNLVQVVEHNGGNNYTTAYEYDGNNNLTKITDALSNIRNFTYDGLSRRLTAQDLHAPADGTFGTWSYAYDDAGNLASSTDPRGQIIEYAYDDLNRVLTENFTGAGGTEVSFAYDGCSEGVGRLCGATSTDAATQFAYNALGGIAIETKTVDATGYTTSYAYDRQGNMTGIVYPDASEVAYAYNEAGLPENVQYKPEGGSFSEIVSDLNYAPTGAVAEKVFGNGVVSTYTYDPNQLYRLTNIYTTASSTEELLGGGGMSILNLPDGGLLNSPNFAFSVGRRLALASSGDLLQLFVNEAAEENGTTTQQDGAAVILTAEAEMEESSTTTAEEVDSEAVEPEAVTEEGATTDDTAATSTGETNAAATEPVVATTTEPVGGVPAEKPSSQEEPAQLPADDETASTTEPVREEVVRSESFSPSIGSGGVQWGLDASQGTYALEVSDDTTMRYSDSEGYISFTPVSISWDGQRPVESKAVLYEKSKEGAYAYTEVAPQFQTVR